MIGQLNPSLAAERANKLIMAQYERFKDRLSYGAQNLMQSGYLVWQTEYTNKLAELQDLVSRHQRNLEILSTNSWEGDKIRAQKELIDEAKLTDELLGAKPLLKPLHNP